MGEFELISRYFAQPAARLAQQRDASEDGERAPRDVRSSEDRQAQVALGIGDDAALLSPPPGMQLVVTSDMLVEGRHFFAGTDPAAIGHKSLAVNLSDLAAMGARPCAFTLSIAMPSIDEAWIAAFSSGLLQLAARSDCALVGGDTTRGPRCISITAMGWVPTGAALLRSGARVGDQVWVSGKLGAAAWAVSLRQVGHEVRRGNGSGDATHAEAKHAIRLLDWPEPRLAEGVLLRGLASAAMDLSDGFAGDIAHILDRSAVPGVRVDWSAVPLGPGLAALTIDDQIRFALQGGDDYELLFTAPSSFLDRIRNALPDARPIGFLVPQTGILLDMPDGSTRSLPLRAFDHFSE